MDKGPLGGHPCGIGESGSETVSAVMVSGNCEERRIQRGNYLAEMAVPLACSVMGYVARVQHDVGSRV